jgi:hypothetical protein
MGGPRVLEYNTQTAEQLRDQFGFAGIQVLPDFITADEEINLLHCLDQVPYIVAYLC